MDPSSVLIIAAVALPLWAIVLYNRLITRKNMVSEGWSGIDVQLKRQANLIPNLIETVKGYMKHERETLEAVIQARNQASQSL
ncbi:MAG: LemA family protein, partial [Alphaproteobacteria bacterium]|nr:LemA family protein [Alphaproteobacteria bacterium]